MAQPIYETSRTLKCHHMSDLFIGNIRPLWLSPDSDHKMYFPIITVVRCCFRIRGEKMAFWVPKHNCMKLVKIILLNRDNILPHKKTLEAYQTQTQSPSVMCAYATCRLWQDSERMVHSAHWHTYQSQAHEQVPPLSHALSLFSQTSCRSGVITRGAWVRSCGRIFASVLRLDGLGSYHEPLLLLRELTAVAAVQRLCLRSH